MKIFCRWSKCLPRKQNRCNQANQIELEPQARRSSLCGKILKSYYGILSVFFELLSCGNLQFRGTGQVFHVILVLFALVCRLIR
jgi:hypothetical protein